MAAPKTIFKFRSDLFKEDVPTYKEIIKFENQIRLTLDGYEWVKCSRIKVLYDIVAAGAGATNLDVPANQTENLLFVRTDTTGGVATISLPTIGSIAGSQKKLIHVVDVGNNAFVNNITIQRSGADLINGDTDTIIDQNRNALSFVSDAVSNWNIF